MPTLAEKIEIISVDKYLKGEPISEIKYEYVEGLVYAVASTKLNGYQLKTEHPVISAG